MQGQRPRMRLSKQQRESLRGMFNGLCGYCDQPVWINGGFLQFPRYVWERPRDAGPA